MLKTPYNFSLYSYVVNMQSQKTNTTYREVLVPKDGKDSCHETEDHGDVGSQNEIHHRPHHHSSSQRGVLNVDLQWFVGVRDCSSYIV